MVRSVKVRCIVSSSECCERNIVKMSKLNAIDLEIHVKRMAYFSWGWEKTVAWMWLQQKGWCMVLQSL